MITGRRFAAIDIGSNAVRLLLSKVFETDNGPYFRKISLIRMPIRLGEDAFILGKISMDKADRLIDTIRGFKALVAAYRPLSFRACATSAMRESGNGEKIRKRILTKRIRHDRSLLRHNRPNHHRIHPVGVGPPVRRYPGNEGHRDR